MEPNSPWKKPDEVMHLHRLNRRKKALQKRMRQPQSVPNSEEDQNNGNNIQLNFSRILDGEKRRNPFSKNNHQDTKRIKTNDNIIQSDQSNKTLFELIKLPNKHVELSTKDVTSDKLATFSNLLQKYTADHAVEPVPETKYKYLPIDWALKTKLRLMSLKPFAWSQQLKASEEASGITGFVRCIDTTSSPTLDTSPRARFHQTCLYWQHPNLPWLNLYPRTSGKVAATSFLATNEEVKQALLREWTESFRSLFQLVRARHCPYFYVCANTFTCLFRAAGLCGVSEPCVLVTPTTRGFRQALRQEDVEFTMPLKSDNKRKLNNSDSRDEEKPKNSSTDSCYDTMDETKLLHDNNKPAKKEDCDDASDDEDDLDPDEFLSQLGFEPEDIKRINKTESRKQNAAESSVDSAAQSLVFARGADAQALFNFLLNCKSIVSPTGPLAGVPPTLVAPVAFHGGALQPLKVRESAILVDSVKYYSIEATGPILPTAVHGLLHVLRSSSSAHVSATFAHHQPTRAFCWAAGAIAQDECSKENEPYHVKKAFNKENLSDCGLSDDLLQHFCSNDPNVIKCIDSVKYNVEDDTYTW